MEKSPKDGADNGAWDWVLSVYLCFPQIHSGVHQPAQIICHYQRLSTKIYDSSVDVMTFKLINLMDFFHRMYLIFICDIPLCYNSIIYRIYVCQNRATSSQQSLCV